MADTAPSTPQRISNLGTEMRRYEFTLSDYWRILIKRRMIVFFSFVSVLTISIIYTNSKTPLFEAAAAVRIATRPRAFQYDTYMNRNDTLTTYASAITGEDVMLRVVVRLGLLPPNAKMEDLTQKASEIRGAISTGVDEGTGTISISVIYPNPELAAAIANQTAQTFVEVDLLEKTKQARNLRRFVENQLNFFSDKLQKTEDQMREFRQSGRALGIASGMDQRLSEMEKEKNSLLKQFTEKHPDIIKLNSEINNLRERIKKLPTDELAMARMQRDLELNDHAYRTMKDKYESARLMEAEQVSDVTVVESATIPEEPILPKKNSNKMVGAFVGLIVGVVLAFTQENLDTSIGTIEDVEHTVRLPVIGVVPYFNPNKENVAWWRLDLALFNLFKQRSDQPAEATNLIMNQDSFSTLAEAYRILRTFVEFLIGKKEGEAKVLLITSTGPQEGKTLTASNLAISLAQAGRKVLLIDADLRRPTLHRLFGLKRSPGLTDVLIGTVSLEDARRTMGDILVGETSQWDHLLTTKMLDRLEILVTGIHSPTPAELLSSEGMKSFLALARQRYDYVIIDTPPVLPVTDARTLGMLADATFFVYRAGKTARRALTRAKEELDLAGVKIKGIILNQATPEVTLTDAYYYQYYGEKKEPKKGQPAAKQKSA